MANFRADWIANFTYAVTLAAPVVSWLAIRRAKARSFERHRALQVGLLTVCWVAVLLLEVKIRLSGGSGSLVAAASEQFRPLARGLVGVHITGAVLTYLLWTWLAVVSWKRFGQRLPGDFSARHRKLGLTVFGGLCFTAVSATGMYFFTFVL
jgi:putative membrane protein